MILPKLALFLPALLQGAATDLPSLTVVPVKPGLDIITGAGGNSILRSTKDGLLLVDAKSDGEGIYAALRERIRSISAAPIRYLVNTHYHGDHSGNDARFRAMGVPVIAQQGFLRELAHFVAPSFNPTEKPSPVPQLLYRDSKNVTLGQVSVMLHHFGAGHTGSDSFVHFPDLGVLAFGDQLATAPLPDYAGGASLPGWIASLDRALALRWDMAIPGHGAPADRSAVIAFRKRLQMLLDRARAAVAAGATRDTLFEAIRHDDLFPMQPAFWTMAAQRDGLYADAQPPKPGAARPK